MTDRAYNEAKMRTQQKLRMEMPGDLWGVKQHHWNTRANENHQLIPSGMLSYVLVDSRYLEVQCTL